MPDLNQSLSNVALLVAMLELIVGLYVLALNSKHTANRHVGGFMLLLAVNTFAVGTITNSTNILQATGATILLAATSAAILPVQTLTTIALLKPEWLSGRWGWLRWLPQFFALLPFALTIIDLAFGTSFWYTGLPNDYSGGFVRVNIYSDGFLHDPISAINFYVFASTTLGFLLYFSFFSKEESSVSKGLARVLLAATAVAGLGTALPGPIEEIGYLSSNTLYVLAYGYAAFQQMVSEQRLQRGTLQRRMTALIVIVTVPLAIVMTVFLTTNAQQQIERDALKRLEQTAHTTSDQVVAWLEMNQRALHNLVISTDIISMDRERQTPLLKNMASIYSEMYLISTTDLNGFNVARSDNAALTDYSDRWWYQNARDGVPITTQTLIGRTSGQPALVMSMPIYKDQGQIVGVGMFASDLDEISHLVDHSDLGAGAVAFVVDENDQLIAHPDPNETSEMRDYSNYPPVIALRAQGANDHMFADQGDIVWHSYGETLDNGWAVIVQQPESALFASVIAFQRAALIILLVGAGILIVMTSFTIRQGIRPIGLLTQTAEAIIAGDLDQTAPVFSEDELGLLARTFNTMTAQLRELIGGLENRVNERTEDLARRALQLRVTAEVAREAAAIRDMEQLLDSVVNQISQGFGFYHVGIFLLSLGWESDALDHDITTPGNYAVLRAANSEGGQRMLAHGHRLKIGEVGIVGYVAGTGLPRIALDVGADAVFFDNPDLPDTRSEMALPLKIQERVIGVLDVQSKEPDAFSDEDIEILQVLADQIALAIENTRLLAESQRAFQEMEGLYGLQIREGWLKRLASRALTYGWDIAGVKSLEQPERDSELNQDPPAPQAYDALTIRAPITLRGQRLGSLLLRRSEEQGAWTAEEQEIINQTLTQVALALENARLLEEVQTRAALEQTINRLTASIAQSLDMDRVLQAAVSELGELPAVVDASIFLSPPTKSRDTTDRLDASGNGRGEDQTDPSNDLRGGTQ